jgi:hypothetical protein
MKEKFFGMNSDMLPYKLPVDSHRLFKPSCCWSQVHTAKDTFNSAGLIEQCSKLLSAGITDLIVELGGTPAWMSSAPNYAGYPSLGSSGFPLDLHADGSGSNQTWREWCAFIGKFFASQSSLHVSGWCPWNEFTRGVDYAGGKSWLGTHPQMVRLSEDARAILTGRGSTITSTGESIGQVLKSVNLTSPSYSPTGSFIQCPSTGGEDWYMKKTFPSYLSTNGAKEAIEVWAVHPYGSSPENGIADCQNFIATIKPFSTNQPIWATEGGWGRAVIDDKPAFISAYYKGLFNLPNVERFYWYAYEWPSAPMIDQNGDLNETGDSYLAVYNELKKS